MKDEDTGVEQRPAHSVHTRKVEGSNPSPGTTVTYEQAVIVQEQCCYAGPSTFECRLHGQISNLIVGSALHCNQCHRELPLARAVYRAMRSIHDEMIGDIRSILKGDPCPPEKPKSET